MAVPETMAWLKAILKIVVIIAFGIVLFMFNHVAGLAAFLYGYFSMPTKYSIKRPFKAAQAWLRLFVAGCIVGVIFLTFSTAGGALSSASFSLAVLSIAFFFVFPHREESAEVESFAGGETGVGKLFARAYGGKGWKSGESIGKYIFIGLFVAGVILSASAFMSLTGWLSNIVWAIILLTGIGGALAGRASRPMMGLLMIGVMMFAFSFAYTETVGRIMFGYWWPQIESGVNFIIEPIMGMFRSAQSMWDDATLLATCPQCYYQRQLIKQQAASSSEGSTSSLTFSDFRLIPENIEPVLEIDRSKSIPTITEKSGGRNAVYVQVSNTGEFAAEDIRIVLPEPKIGVKKSYYEGAVLSEVLPSPVGAGKVTVQSCPGGEKTTDGCIWSGLAYPGAVHMATFQIDWGKDIFGLDKGLAEWYKHKDTRMIVFTYGGEAIPVKPEARFSYWVNVIYPMRVMNSDALDAALIAKRVDLATQVAKYSGGPLKASLWAPLQPLRSGEKTVVTASLENTETGDVRDVNYCIYVPKIGNNIQPPENIAGVTEITDSDALMADPRIIPNNLLCVPQQNTSIVRCHISSIPASAHCGEGDLNCNLKRCSFYVNYDIGDSTEKTFSITGAAKYLYYVATSKTAVVAATSAEQAAVQTGAGG